MQSNFCMEQASLNNFERDPQKIISVKFGDIPHSGLGDVVSSKLLTDDRWRTSSDHNISLSAYSPA